MQAASFPNLLFHKIVPVATYLEVVLHFRIDGDDGLADLHQGNTCHCINLGILIKLVKDESIFFDSTLIDAEK